MFHGHGVVRSDVFTVAVSFIVGFQIPAFACGLFHCGNGVVNIIFACTTNIAGRNVAFVVGRFTTKEFRQVGLSFVQLFFSRGFVRSRKVRTAQSGVTQSTHCTGRTVNTHRLATVLTNFESIGKFQLYAAFNGFAGNVAVAFDIDSVAQSVFVAAACTTDIDAFSDIFSIGVGFLINFVQLRSVNSIGAVSSKRAFGNFGDLVAAVVQTGSSQRHLVRRTVCTNLQSISIQYAIARDNAFSNHAGRFY